jgi:hypothetical protein
MRAWNVTEYLVVTDEFRLTTFHDVNARFVCIILVNNSTLYGEVDFVFQTAQVCVSLINAAKYILSSNSQLT